MPSNSGGRQVAASLNSQTVVVRNCAGLLERSQATGA